jgi:hypothetical protein
VLVLRLLEALDAHVVRLLHPLRAHLASLRLLISVSVALVLRLNAVVTHLLASRHAILRDRTIAVLALDGLGLRAALPVLPLDVLLLPLHGEALRVHGMSATAAPSEHLRVAAAVVSTATAAASEHLGMATTVVAATAAATSERRGVSAAATAAAAVLLSLLIALAAAVRPRASRGCDREGGDAGREKHPGHDRISFRTAKTARSLHRSNR